ncbi:c-type cytochrome biogenesis protein CcsB [Kribbella sp. ALI-6-A]|uniref:c-type cytochrome biogenesis protein CcsB n=1 Tax=Kribbella sp. ALI-6-A TaxID=1933817 RepID=UPI00097C313F|nr:c-type cytochrome biogenesis protein CcsB [Kribbella sp. ALI-6-A]ONI68519.1 c-type cytochrome biogenesis protein CcsB [Kribbella sp. ALI-6-A]
MNSATLASLSNLLVPTATVIYTLALLAHTVEWSSGLRVRKPAEQKVLVGADGAEIPAGADADGTDEPDRSSRWQQASRIGVLLTVLAFVMHAGGVLTRGLAAGRVPWGNMYEFAITASLAVAAVYLFLLTRQRLEWLGLLVTFVLAATLGIAVLALYVPAADLLPALHSYWLVIHVSAAAVAGGGFTVGGLASILYLIKSRAEAREADGKPMSAALRRVPSSAGMDAVAYKVHAFAFPLWTFGVLVAGPIWAYYAWGRAWGWDPKEVWSLVTWVVYAAYLHARATAGWRGRRAAWVAIAGWVVFLFNFIGVNLLLSGIHAYSGL